MPEISSRDPMVRCPKCNDILPELPPYSVYRCDGCGALSRAEKRSSVDDGLSEKSWEERRGEVSEREGNGENFGFDRGRVIESPLRARYSGDAIRNSPIRESNLGGLGSGRKSDVQSKSSGRSNDGDLRKSPLRESSLGDLDGRGKSSARSVRGGVRKTHALGDFDERRSIERDVGDPEEMEAREKVGAWIDHVEEEVEYANRFVTQKGSYYDQVVDETESEYGELYSSRRGEILHDDWVPGGDRRLPRGHRDLRPRDGYVREFRAEESEFRGVQKRFPVHPVDGPSNFHSYYDYDEPRRAPERFIGTSGPRNVEMNRAELLRQYNELEEHLSRTGGFADNPTRRGHQSISDFYDGHDELLRSRRSMDSVGPDERARMRPHHMTHRQVAGPFSNDRDMDDINSFPPSRLGPVEVASDDDPSWPHHPGRTPRGRPNYYIPRRSMDSSYDPSGLTPQREILHHPRNLRPNVQPPPASGHRRYLDPQTDTASDFPDPYGESTASGSRFLYSTPNQSSHSQRSADSKSDGGGSAQEHGKRVLVVKKNQLLCHPIAGAAPLVICYNCSQLLRVPKKLVTMKKTQFRLQCGSCHTTLSFNFDRKKPPSKMSESDQKNTLASSPAGIIKSESYVFDPTGYTFHSTDSESSLQLHSRRLNSSEAQKPPGSESHVLSANKAYEKETGASGHDMGSTITDVSNVDAPAEFVLNSDEIPGPAGESAKFDNGGGNKIGESSSAGGTVPRPFRDLSPPTNTSNAKADVFVNGQLLPYRVVRKAERLAGPVSPGNYWYDSRAGFWGVMGSYCLGIIPPFIQEFGFPMPVSCAGGTTGIYVNGRELHEKDLELLASRRLPLTRNKWYVIDISGKVEDEETGDIVVNMGKLAPSVEKARHGFGMQPPEM